ncbi:hypothetical protein O3G_MSEX001944 [Manduca sexta]|uniref:Uncharacterized protein n=1 Tax=Manduca sexta TaxID=7130 RepID=A0A922CCD1_MANSE|nr:hypothetical protein O3G_MSEX001944 [Manduca sexta]
MVFVYFFSKTYNKLLSPQVSTIWTICRHPIRSWRRHADVESAASKPDGERAGSSAPSVRRSRPYASTHALNTIICNHGIKNAVSDEVTLSERAHNIYVLILMNVVC